jgi:hypothetical protein
LAHIDFDACLDIQAYKWDSEALGELRASPARRSSSSTAPPP